MKRYMNMALLYAVLAMVGGVFYREFTKFNGFTAKTTLGVVHLLMPGKPEEDTVREREYTVTRDTITVGVESSGLVDTGPNAHSFEAGTVVEELLVKVGSEVKKGDPLASISTENLKELIGTAQDELSDARAALLQASSAKDVLIAQNKKDKQDGLDRVQQEYASQTELLTSEKKRLEASISQQEAILVQLQQQIADGSAQVGDLEKKVERLKTKINQNILEIGRLNEELLNVDDGSEKRKALNNQIANLQYDIQKLNGQLSERVSLAANNTAQIQSLEAEIQLAREEIAQLEQQGGEDAEQQIQKLQQKIADKQKQIRRLSYTDEINALDSQIAGKESQLRKAQKELNFLSDDSEERNAIQLKITKLQNENTEMQQEIDAYMADPAFAQLERLKEERQTCEDSLKSNYEGLSLKLEEMERAEKQFQQALENQNGDNTFLDYKTSEELKSINENIAKASRNVQTAQEKVARLQAFSQNPTIYAQLDGVVTTLNYKVGDTVVDGKPLCIVGELDEITMTVPVSASDIGSVSVGQKVNLYVDAYAEQKFIGTVKERLLVANDNGEYPVIISIDPSEQVLLPGMKAYATIILKEKTDVLTLSNKAITLENGQQYVLVRDENGELVRKQIVTGFSDGRVSEILDGLSEQDVVIVQE